LGFSVEMSHYPNYAGEYGEESASAEIYASTSFNQQSDHYGGNEGTEYDQQAYVPEESPINEPGIWGSQFSAIMDNTNNSITSLEYDNVYERLWAGYKNGRVMSLKFDHMSEVDTTTEASRYCSFMSSNDAVKNLHTIGDFVLSTSASEIRMHNNGGLSMAHLYAPEVIGTGGVSESASYTCSSLCHPGGFDMQPSHILAGTKRNVAVVYDLSTFDTPMLTIDIGSPAVCCRENRYYTLVACDDGGVRLLDGRLRNNRILHTIEAHTGPCMDAWLSHDDSTLYTCGKVARSLNQYDPAAPVKYSYDPLVKVFDLRTNRQLAPLHMPGASPYFIRFIPSPSSQGGYGAQLLLASGNGTLQISDPNGNGSDAQILYSPLASQRDSVTAVAVSSSGQLITTGTYSGGISQFAIGLSTEELTPGHRINYNSIEQTLPPQAPPVPQVSLDSKAQVLASSYVLRPKNNEEPLSSSFSSTPNLSADRFKLTSKRVISKELLTNIHSTDFIGTVDNPGFELNSMLYTPSINKIRGYAVSDPRNVETTELGLTPAKNQPSPKEIITQPERPNILPSQYREQHSFRGKARMNRFNYAAHNDTSCIGLENTAPNSYTNTVLQLLFVIPEIRAIALAAQASTYHHQNPHTLWSELGFLFHMIQSIEKKILDDNDDIFQRIVTPSNFQRTFQCIPEAVALGLFDGSKIDSQSLVQTFTRFLLQRLHQEADLESRHQSDGASRRNVSRSFSAVDDIYGFTVVSSTRFLISNKTEIGTPNKAFALDLIYPSSRNIRKEGLTNSDIDLMNLSEAVQLPRGHPASFSQAIWGSLRKETSMRGWCKSSESYEPFKQVRSMINLPRVLTLLCGETQKDPQSSTISGALGEVQSSGSMHTCYWNTINIAGSAWLPAKLEVAMLRQGADSTTQAKLIVSALLVPGPTSPRGTLETWVIFDGIKDCIAPGPASSLSSYGIVIKPILPPAPVNLNKPYNPNPLPIAPEVKSDEWDLVVLNLVAVISQVQSELKPIGTDGVTEHAVLHVKRNNASLTNENTLEVDKEWVLFNDFSIQYTNALDTVSFPAWRHPCVVFFNRADYHFGVGDSDATSSVSLSTHVPSSVLALPSQSNVPCVRIGTTFIPSKGELIAFDAEFVSVELENAEVNAEGQRVTVSEARQNVARISLVRGGPRILGDGMESPPMEVIADDYIIPSETTLDYLTRFSGIIAEDLQPGVSRHAVVHNRTAYLKLRFFVDRGCIFVGHGLNKDFETANIFIPKEQIIDTVELWRLPGQRKLSLRFLAAYFLKQDIQDEVHDSIEDAKTALLLYRHYEKELKKGHAHLQSVLQQLYSYGGKTNWTIQDDITIA
jgi:PAB-dependent poly(A)-specific ribonuclease subunit 2